MKILDIHRESKGVYGSPRITAELHDGGEIITEKSVAKLTRSLGIVGISLRTFKIRITVVDPFASFPNDLVQRRFDQDQPDASGHLTSRSGRVGSRPDMRKRSAGGH